MKKCIVSFASAGRESYQKALLRMIEVSKPHWDGDFILYSQGGYCDKYLDVNIELGHDMPHCIRDTAKPHNLVPYQFKLIMIQKARDAGYEQIIWLDSTIKLIKNPQPLLDQATNNGVVVFDNIGHKLSHWIHDSALIALGVNPTDRDYINTLPQIMACVIIFDFRHPVAQETFEEWWVHSQNGVSFCNGYSSSRPEYIAHRHDQCILSYLLYKRGIKYNPYGQLVYPPHDTDGQFGTDIYFVNKGI